MLKWIGRLFIIAGISVLAIVGYLIYDFYLGSNYQVQEVEDYLTSYGYETETSTKKKRIDTNKLMNFTDFSPNIGEVYGTLEIPTIDLNIPIVLGVEQEHMRYGVGHDPKTSFPSEGKQVFLSGHNNSAFLKIGDLNPGDDIFINTPYGRFEYNIERSEIAHESETWRVGNDEYEELVLMTCYPAFSLTRPDHRYFVYANPIQ